MKLLKAIVLFSLLLPLFLGAEEHVQIGSRPMNEEAIDQIKATKSSVEDNEEEPAPLEFAGYLFDQYPPIFYSDSHHWLNAVTILDNNQYTLELEDGSVWKIHSYDGGKILNWLSNDPLIITQNNRWFSKHSYRIINKSNGTSAEASLYLGPIVNGEFSRFIIGIDRDKKEILLSDNSHWALSYLDSAIFKDWSLNDYLIIGTNSNTSIWDSKSDRVLINVNLNNSARASKF